MNIVSQILYKLSRVILAKFYIFSGQEGRKERGHIGIISLIPSTPAFAGAIQG